MARLRDVTRGVFADTRPLANPHFRRLWLANIVTVVGAQITVVTVPAQIYADTGSSAYVGLTGVFGLVPLVVFGLYGGALADVFDRRTILVVTTTGLIVTSGLFWLQAFLGSTNVWLLLSLFAVQQAFFAVNQPTRSAVLPKLLPPELLPAANSLNMTVMQAGGIGGPLVAGVLLPFTGFAWLYAVDTVTLLATLGAVVRLPSLAVVGAATVVPGLRAVADGFVYLRTQPILLMSFVVDLIAMVFGMPRALFPEIAEDRFGGGSAVGWLFAAIAIGSVLGGLTSGWIGRVRRQGVALVLAVVGWGVAVGLAGLAHSLWLMVLLLAVGGAADLVSAVYRQSILQTFAPDRLRGRLQGVFTVVVAGGPRLGDLRAGATADLTGPTASWAGGGFAAAGLAVVLALAFPALLRYRPPADPEATR